MAVRLRGSTAAASIVVILVFGACTTARPQRETIPDERREVARFADRHTAHANALRTELRTESGRPLWRSMGPQPSIDPGGRPASGRLSSIAISPVDSRRILVGAAGGGIWLSEDGGQTFSPVADDQSDLSVASIAFAPESPHIVYAAMRWDPFSAYDLGSGVLRSSDGGETWSRVDRTGLADRAVNWSIAVDPLDPDRVYLAQESALVPDPSPESATGMRAVEGGVHVSRDGGVTWTRVLAAPIRDLRLHPAIPNVVYAASAGIGPVRIHRSEDSGATWTIAQTLAYPASAISHVRLAVTSAAPDRVYAVSGRRGSLLELVASSDRGLTWTRSPLDGVSTAQFDYNLALAVSPADPAVMYVGTVPLHKSSDGGRSFARLAAALHVDQHALVFDPRDPDVLYAGNDGGLYRTDDGGASFVSLNASLGVTQFYALGVVSGNPAIMCGGTQDNGTQQYAGGSTWSTFADGDGGPCVIHPFDDTISVFFTKPGIITRRSAGAAAIVARPNRFSSDRMASIPPMIASGDSLYFGTYRLYEGLGFGDSWLAPAGSLDLTFGAPDVLRSIAVSPSDRQVLYTGSAQGRVMTSGDRGITWRDVSAGLPRRAITGIAVDPADAAVVYITLFAWGTGHVFITRDGGEHWTDISGNLPDTPANCVVFEPGDNQTVYVGTDLGVFRSRGGGVWTYLRSGMPPAPVSALVAHPSGIIRAATYGRGVYEYVVGSERRRRAY